MSIPAENDGGRARRLEAYGVDQDETKEKGVGRELQHHPSALHSLGHVA
jgi:hypothetical protein